ncbi:deoxyhypusine hydroxylase-like isoform x1 [Plasmopara halstedii]|uniref:Deoxyhypusine hydroxylase n=1 Tax=Plasmopara halstedii TaxID=4781 RepID=A0A0P1AJD1_PLAHL|nr:deoxyhypusine hydroxylase-like isoform x1 [Plasmopara halstedii]CEG40981.1 deoxyhypusine hydroxylase-like isoform x1 [Plasmopara halstedii]|eukprot:XP_024577350.1 deoxyhypusine hydroxylase-like isoform x1 [Plasmopara halstedii]
MSSSPATPSFDQLCTALLNPTEPIGKRTRAIFYLRTRGNLEDLEVLLEALKNRQDSELMRHELAYVIGQFQKKEACEILHEILADETDDVMVRHEVAEALGAIGSVHSVSILEKYCHDPAPEISETCKLALKLVHYKSAKANGTLHEAQVDQNPYLSEDPAPAAEMTMSTVELRTILLDPRADMFLRYRALFSLRNRNTNEAALALAEAFDDSNTLLKHEVAYVMGQMANPVLVPALTKVLLDQTQHRMVRHEAAEALGAIGTIECEKILTHHLNDNVQVVRESCQVALDIMDYWASNEIKS